MKLKASERVSIDEAERRALAAMEPRRLHFASEIATRIWPGHSMKPQGAGAAASRILKRLEKRGLVRWTARDDSWGWCRNV